MEPFEFEGEGWTEAERYYLQMLILGYEKPDVRPSFNFWRLIKREYVPGSYMFMAMRITWDLGSFVTHSAFALGVQIVEYYAAAGMKRR